MIKIELGNRGSTPLTGRNIVLALLLCFGLGLALVMRPQAALRTPAKPASDLPVTPNSVADRVAALGRLEPQGRIIHLSAPGANQRLMQLLVQEGDTVKANQVVAITDAARRYQALVDNARARVTVIEQRLAQTQAGEKAGTIEAQRRKVVEATVKLTGRTQVQQAAIAQQEIALHKAELTYQRYTTLAAQGAVSQADVDDRRLQLEIERSKLQQSYTDLAEQRSTGAEQVNEARATLSSLTEVRPSDTAVVAAELNEAVAQLRQAEVDLASALIRAPRAGQILSVNTQVGELIGPDGIMDIGQTQQMVVIAEVYERDIQAVKVGKPVTVVSEYGGFAGELQGTVSRIKLKIDKPRIISDDPSTKSDARVIQVEIQLSPQDSLKVQNLSNLQVRAFIQAR